MSNFDVLDGMTPDELRALADEAEARGGKPARPAFVRRVEVDGVPVDVDMRRVRDIRTLSLVAKVEKGGEQAGFAAVELFDWILGGERERVVAALSDEDGFCSVEAYSGFCARLLEAVGAKN